MPGVDVPSSSEGGGGGSRWDKVLRFFASDGLRLNDRLLVVEQNMTTFRSMSPRTWNEIYELVGRIQYKAIESGDWDLVVLDESFAALDPETLERALRCVLQRARTLLVIAHP